MRKYIILAASAAALITSPAFAQLGAGVGTTVNTTVSSTVDSGRTLGNVVDRVDTTTSRVIDHADRFTNRTLNSTQFALVTRTDVVTGSEVRDSRGQRLGTVSRLDGQSAVVVSGRNVYRVPLSALYRHTSGSARTLVTSIPRARLSGHANVNASVSSAAHVGN